ncbi:MAG: phospholipid carrier-dependent glycosyltransferase [Spirochaetales bacterium]|nr:phospholipid carrier-dependent glycosyltransferase [Spirochaetales bacterium]
MSRIINRLAFMCILMFLTAPFLGAQANLVRNGDFEDIVNDMPSSWRMEAWKMGQENSKIYMESDKPKSGSYYVTIENINSNDARLVQVIAVKPNTEYMLSCWIKAEIKDKDRAGANISVMDASINTKSNEFYDTNGEWKYCEMYVTTGPEQNTLTIAIRLGFFGGDVKGTASFDDFRVEKSKSTAADDSVVRAIALQEPIMPAIAAFGLIFLGIMIIAFVIVLIIQKLKPGFLNGLLNDPYHNPLKGIALWNHKEEGLNKKDWLIMGVLTLVYSLIAFPNLGSMKAPQTGWFATAKGESCYVDFGSPQEVKRVAIWEGLPTNPTKHGEFAIEYSDDTINWTNAINIQPKTMGYWYYFNTGFTARYVRVKVEFAGTITNEIVFIGSDRKTPIEVKKVIVEKRLPTRYGKMENLFDEPGTLAERPNHLNGMSPGFDEQYHARTAWEHIHFWRHYETTHPPLGKLFISLGVLIFGMTPFGWRFAGNFFGILMVPLTYLLGREIFKKREYALISAFFMSFDFMHFTQSRIATIDTYGVFFIMLMFYFMMRYYNMDFFKAKFSKTLVPLLMSGIACGLGAASKWTVIYAFPGLAIFFAICLGKRWRERKEYNEIYQSSEIRRQEKDRLLIGQKLAGFNRAIIITIALCLVFFIVIPSLIYFFSYTPLMMVKERGYDFSLDYVWKQQTYMYNYHAGTKVTHSYSSTWPEWPLILKPMWYHNGEGNLPSGLNQRLWAMGSPAVWWIGSIAGLGLIILVIARAFRNLMKGHYKNRVRDPAATIIIIGMLTTYLPWIVSARTLTFIYHFFPVVPFIIFAIVYFIKYSREFLTPYYEKNKPTLYPAFLTSQATLLLGYFITLVVLFFMFYPIIAGTVTNKFYVKQFLQWLPRWYFG